MITLSMQGSKHISDTEGTCNAYICSTVADVAKLPTGINSDDIFKPRPGSTAILPDPNGGIAKGYVLASNRRWVLVRGGEGGTELSYWEKVQKSVRDGRAAVDYPIGTQLAVDRNGENIIFDVVAHDYNVDPQGKYAHSMTLLSHDAVMVEKFEGSQALYYCENGLAAGVYHFTVANDSWNPIENGKNYQFTLETAVPVGGQIVADMSYSQSFEGSTVKVYASPSATVESETTTLTEGADGTFLGATDGKTNNLNILQRIYFGANNWKQSSLRQLLNSDKVAGSVWTPQTRFDRPPSWVADTDGWMKGLDPAFLAVVGVARIDCSTNSIYESDGSTNQEYTTDDKFWLPSASEIFGADETLQHDGSVFEYYDGVTDDKRIKRWAGQAVHWWTRTVHKLTPFMLRRVRNDGTPDVANGNVDNGISVACTIY